ncbi:MAG: hypothetical protein A2079_01380 [Geobacteraceae bacterium GWC2_48_7]|nr:MAG: hypothetical protein A2079_01380 [Geobacteraceae bacterium GWC2_48_7]
MGNITQLQHFLKVGFFSMLVAATVLVNGCTKHVARPEFLTAPVPITSNSGEYLAPYTQDAVLTEWTDKMANVGLGATVGGAVGAAAASYALRQVPLVGGMLGDYAGRAIGRKIAIESVGGWDYIKSKSDLSFNTSDELALYMFTKYCYNEHYFTAVNAETKLYPSEYEKGKFEQVLITASADVCKDKQCPTINEYRTMCGQPNPNAPTIKLAAPRTDAVPTMNVANDPKQ